MARLFAPSALYRRMDDGLLYGELEQGSSSVDSEMAKHRIIVSRSLMPLILAAVLILLTVLQQTDAVVFGLSGNRQTNTQMMEDEIHSGRAVYDLDYKGPETHNSPRTPYPGKPSRRGRKPNNPHSGGLNSGRGQGRRG